MERVPMCLKVGLVTVFLWWSAAFIPLELLASSFAPSPVPKETDYAPFVYLRPCQNYTNRLFLRPYGLAGVSDRISLLTQLINMAGYLCATVDYPRPFHVLSVKHNSGINISVKVEWSDFVKYNTSVFNNVAMYSTIPEPLEPFERHFDDKIYANWTRIVMKRFDNKSFSVVEDFTKADDIVTTQQEKMMDGEKNVPGFIWIVDGRFSSWKKQLLAFLSDQKNQLLEVGDVSQARMLPIKQVLSDKCDRFVFDLSNQVKRIADMIWNDSISFAGGSKNGTVVGSLNLRRGDGIDQCDTELPTMHDYLSCSFNGTDSSEASIVLLLSSDERDTTYRDAILALASSFPNVQSMDLDKMVREKVDRMVQEGSLPSWLSDNNYFIFGIAQCIHCRAQFRLIRQRKQRCYPCQGHTVLEQISK